MGCGGVWRGGGFVTEVRIAKVIEKHYSPRELSFLLGFDEKWWRQRAQAGDLTLRDRQGQVIAQPLELAGELRVPASAVNAYLASHPYSYDAGVKARNTAELRRKLSRPDV